MNFDNQTEIDVLLGRLLAFVIMFEKKNQQLKQKLAGSQDFHTKLAFQKLDGNRSNLITAQQLHKILIQNNINQREQNCSFFLRKYSKSGVLTYYQFLKIIVPKNNKILSQRLMIRTQKKGGKFQQYLLIKLLQLIKNYIQMSIVTESLRKSIQKNKDLTHLELVQFFKRKLLNPQGFMHFLSISTGQTEQYDIELQDIKYLKNHLLSGNDLEQMTDSDIMELINPIDYTVPKYTQRFNQIQDQIKQQKQNTFYASNKLDFLSKTYRRANSNTTKQLFSPIPQNNYQNQFNSLNFYKQVPKKQQIRNIQYSRAMYIDNFTKQDNSPPLQLDKFLRAPFRKQVEIFQDDLRSNLSSASDSAFDRG